MYGKSQKTVRLMRLGYHLRFFNFPPFCADNREVTVGDVPAKYPHIAREMLVHSNVSEVQPKFSSRRLAKFVKN